MTLSACPSRSLSARPRLAPAQTPSRRLARPTPLALALALALALWGASGAVRRAAASPWLLPPGAVTLSARYDYAYARDEFLASTGRLTPFSLNGQYSANTYSLGARLGLSEWLELEVSLPLREVTYQSDPVILNPTALSGEAAYDHYQRNILNFNQSAVGVADVGLAARLRLMTAPLVMSLELGVTAPAGYAPPEGTFGDRPASVKAFVSDVGRYVAPENIRDDVTLGDGAFAFTPMLHAGLGTGGGFFARASGGLRVRLNGAGDALVGELKAGQSLRPWLLVFVGLAGEKAVTRGRVIGVSVAAKDATLPAADYGDPRLLELIEVTLDRDLLSLPIGLLVRPQRDVELGVNYAQVLWGRNVAKSHVLSVGVTVRTSYL